MQTVFVGLLTHVRELDNTGCILFFVQRFFGSASSKAYLLDDLTLIPHSSCSLDR